MNGAMSLIGTKLPFRNVHCTAASGGNPDIEPTFANDRFCRRRHWAFAVGGFSFAPAPFGDAV